MTQKRIILLGATGSIGTSTLDIIATHPDRYRASVLTAHSQAQRLVDLALRHRPDHVVIGDEARADTVRDGLAGTGITVGAGRTALIEAAAREADLVMAAIVGMAGLEPMMAAARQGTDIALANKEGLVCAGPLLLDVVARHGGTLLPVDSEHNAIFQCLEAHNRDQVEKITLTASGGPFRTRSRAELVGITPAEAVAHPVWSMGAKISVDSATMMNKGLEVIEAALLFGLSESQIDVLIHPQSIVHSMVHYLDGSVLAQLGTPDMRIPIASAMAWPERVSTPAERLDLAGRALSFEAPDEARFPALAVAREALRRGGYTSTLINAINEELVAAFLDNRLKFLEIDAALVTVLEEDGGGPLGSLDDVLDIDARGRAWARAHVARCS